MKLNLMKTAVIASRADVAGAKARVSISTKVGTDTGVAYTMRVRSPISFLSSAVRSSTRPSSSS